MGEDTAPALVIRLGGTYTHLELGNADGDIVGDAPLRCVTLDVGFSRRF